MTGCVSRDLKDICPGKSSYSVLWYLGILCPYAARRAILLYFWNLASHGTEGTVMQQTPTKVSAGRPWTTCSKQSICAVHGDEGSPSLLELLQRHALATTAHTLEGARAIGLSGTRHCANEETIAAAAQMSFLAALSAAMVHVDHCSSLCTMDEPLGSVAAMCAVPPECASLVHMWEPHSQR